MKKIILALIIGSIAIAPATAMDVPDQIKLNEELIGAAVGGNLAETKELIAKGADASYVAPHENFTTALMEVARNSNSFFASDNDRLEIMKLLIQNGAKVNEIEPESGTTALVYAAAFGTPAMVQALIEAGADLWHRNKNGETALIMPIYLNKNETIQLLLEASINLTEQEKKSVVSWLHFNKDMQEQGKAFLTKDTRSLVTKDIIESLVIELHQRVIRAGVREALDIFPALNNEALTQQLRQYLDLNFLRDRVISQSKISRK